MLIPAGVLVVTLAAVAENGPSWDQQGKNKALEHARNQFAVGGETPIVWHVAEEKLANALK